MTALTRFVLRHKALVSLFWVAVAVVGVMTISGTTHRMTNNFSMPGQAFKVDNQIATQYGNGGSQTPYVPVITVPAGQRITDPAVAAATGWRSPRWPARSLTCGSRTTRPPTTRPS
jgi:putative drug exporter of the RND superfamily